MTQQCKKSAWHYAHQLPTKELTDLILELMEYNSEASDWMWEYFYDNMDLDYVREAIRPY